jgi:hypothetical protein
MRTYVVAAVLLMVGTVSASAELISGAIGLTLAIESMIGGSAIVLGGVSISAGAIGGSVIGKMISTRLRSRATP